MLCAPLVSLGVFTSALGFWVLFVALRWSYTEGNLTAGIACLEYRSGVCFGRSLRRQVTGPLAESAVTCLLEVGM